MVAINRIIFVSVSLVETSLEAQSDFRCIREATWMRYAKPTARGLLHHAFETLASMRVVLSQRHTTALKRSAGLASIAVAMAGVSCSDGTTGGPPAPDAEDAATGRKEDAADLTPDGSQTADRTFSDSEDAGAFTSPDGLGADTNDASRIPLCLRLQDPDRPGKILQLSQDVRSDYLTLVAMDCMVRGLFATQSGTVVNWSNDLYDWNLDLWACTDHAATGFFLVHAEVTDLTSADAAVLIDDYLKAATQVLRLSPPEVTQLRQDLVRLGMTAITRQSDERLFSECDANDAGTEADAADGVSR
jgi:hypothetical protein